MKPIVISSYLAFAALSLYAADPQASKETSKPQPVTHVQTQISPPTVGIGDSPLVRAAKATGRLGKKPTQVITNETLVRDGGHFTTSEAPPPIQAVNREAAGQSFDQMAAEVRRARTEAAAAAERARKTEEKKRIAAGLAAARMEGDSPEGIYDDSPALEGGPIQKIKPVNPETVPTKPPQ